MNHWNVASLSAWAGWIHSAGERHLRLPPGSAFQQISAMLFAPLKRAAELRLPGAHGVLDEFRQGEYSKACEKLKSALNPPCFRKDAYDSGLYSFFSDYLSPKPRDTDYRERLQLTAYLLTDQNLMGMSFGEDDTFPDKGIVDGALRTVLWNPAHWVTYQAMLAAERLFCDRPWWNRLRHGLPLQKEAFVAYRLTERAHKLQDRDGKHHEAETLARLALSLQQRRDTPWDRNILQAKKELAILLMKMGLERAKEAQHILESLNDPNIPSRYRPRRFREEIAALLEDAKRTADLQRELARFAPWTVLFTLPTGRR